MDECYIEGGLPAGNLPADSLQTEPSDPLDHLIATHNYQSPISNVLSAGSVNIFLSVEEQHNVMKSIQEIFELEEEEKASEDEEMNDDDEEPPVDFEDQQRRTEKLKGVLPTLAQLWWSDSELMDVAAEKLADGSRARKSSS